MEYDFYRSCKVNIIKAKCTDEFFPMENFFNKSEAVDYETFVDNVRACTDELYENFGLGEYEDDNVNYKVTAETPQIFKLEFSDYELGKLAFVTFMLSYTVETDKEQCGNLEEDFYLLMI